MVSSPCDYYLTKAKRWKTCHSIKKNFIIKLKACLRPHGGVISCPFRLSSKRIRRRKKGKEYMVSVHWLQLTDPMQCMPVTRDIQTIFLYIRSQKFIARQSNRAMSTQDLAKQAVDDFILCPSFSLFKENKKFIATLRICCQIEPRTTFRF